MAPRAKKPAEPEIVIEAEDDDFGLDDIIEDLTDGDDELIMKPKPKSEFAPGEPDFITLSAALAAADARARSSAADAGAARAERSTVAVQAIKAAFREVLNGENVRDDLLKAGVLKGTVSKIVTVLNALKEGVITATDVKSLNGAYNLVKSVRLAGTAAGPSAAPGVPFSAPTPAVVATTPDEAMSIIVNAIKSISDPDEAFKMGGEWITRVTNEISAALKSREDDEEGE